jgi:chlorite dismutase
MDAASADTNPYHHYLFFDVQPEFYQLAAPAQTELKREFKTHLEGVNETIITPYAILGLKAGTTFMLWCRSSNPETVTNILPALLRTGLGAHLALTQTYFGIIRASQYSGRTGKPEQVIQNYDERLPYLILYPFTKTHEWYQLSAENRRSIMGQHIKTGLAHPDIRQCLLYSYGLDDQEFLVSYETPTLEEFQDLIIEMRATVGRPYTLSDTPIYTCLHKPLAELMDWL